MGGRGSKGIHFIDASCTEALGAAREKRFERVSAGPLFVRPRDRGRGLMVVAVLFRSKGSGILDEYPNLSAYVTRGEARPAFERAFTAQLAVFTAASTKDCER
jgi:glutathione S-transferase